MSDKKGFKTSILFKTAFYHVYSTFNMIKVRILVKDVYQISYKKYYENIKTENRKN